MRRLSLGAVLYSASWSAAVDGVWCVRFAVLAEAEPQGGSIGGTTCPQPCSQVFLALFPTVCESLPSSLIEGIFPHRIEPQNNHRHNHSNIVLKRRRHRVRP